MRKSKQKKMQLTGKGELNCVSEKLCANTVGFKSWDVWMTVVEASMIWDRGGGRHENKGEKREGRIERTDKDERREKEWLLNEDGMIERSKGLDDEQGRKGKREKNKTKVKEDDEEDEWKKGDEKKWKRWQR